MGMRSYLYSVHDEEPRYRDMSEWKSAIPLLHYILIGVNPRVVSTKIWDVTEKIAIEGDAAGRDIALRFIDWAEAQGLSFDAGGVREILTANDRQGTGFRLEPGEVYDLMGLDLPEMEAHAIGDAEIATAIVAEVERLLSDPTSMLSSVKGPPEMAYALENPLDRFGDYFATVVYFHLG